ncbi:MAG: beta-glucoside-specific PTS transporter subunit IIABC [Bacillota bacterium]|nr:beta-glucoside-specific PTS transporter subunit IIABC [Bacillota bacterium]
MSKKYEELARQIVEGVGGKANVSDVYHCQTRLRFKLIDESKADQKGLENLNGVTKVLINAGVFQVVIGTHVAEVFEEIEKLVDIKSNKSEQKSEKKGIITTIIDFVAGTFQPIIPALSGAGMVKAVLALLVVFNVITTDSQTYYLLNLFADGVFFFLPMLLAVTEAQKLKCNPILAAGVAAMMMHPNWAALVTAGEPVYFFGVIPFTLATYTSSVIPIILIVFVQAYVEKFLNRWIPKSVNLVFVPMCTFLIMGTLAFSVLGPIGSVVGGYLATFFEFLSTNASWAPAVLIGGFLPVMVMFGLHNGIAPLGVMQMSNLGYDSIFGPGCVCSNMAQATAGLVVALRTRDKNTRQTATSGSITAYMGITEPILYGVNLPKKYPLISAMIGGGLGGLYAGLTQTHRFATGSSGLPAVLLYIGDNSMTCFINIIIAITISIITTAIITFVLSLRFEKKVNEPIVDHEVIQLNQEIVKAPVAGNVLNLSEADDEVFASKDLGDGAVIVPNKGLVVAPFDGTVATLFPTKHAIGLISPNGAEVLIHIGINTVELNGKYFESFVKQGEQVKAGQKLLTFEPDKIKEAGYSTQVMVVVTNSASYQGINVIHEGNIKEGEQLLNLNA